MNLNRQEGIPMTPIPQPRRAADNPPRLRMVNDTVVRVIRERDPDPNTDPLTGEPGAHPVGVGAGAATGAAAGAAVGSLGGPIGSAIGVTLGGVAGGLVGKTIAERVHPTSELEYWRTAYIHRPYAAGGTFVDFEPAYRSTVDEFVARPESVPFEHAEPRLRAAYERSASGAYRAWKDVREASKDAWERVVKRTSETATEAQKTAADRVNDVLQMLNDSVDGFTAASARLADAKFVYACRRYAAERENLAAELRPVIAANGREPTSSTEIRGSIARAWMAVRTALGGGDCPIIENIESAEDHAVATYRDALASDDLTNETRAVLSRQYPIVKAAHDQFRAWKEQLAES
jgi:uncharacterized protein (TIGR02284 family)